MKRTILVAVLLVACILSATVGGTVAWFTDKVEVKNQILTAGNLDIELYKDGTPVNESTDVFTKPALWEPGAVAYADLSLKNVGNLALNYNMRLDAIQENTVTGTDYKLSDVLKIAFVDVEATDRATVLAAAKGKGVAFSEFAVEGSLLPGEENSFNDGLLVVYWEPSAEDNNWNVNNGKTTSDGEAALHIDFGVVVEATQMMEEVDGFGTNDYDANASTKVEAGADATQNGKNLKKMIEEAAPGSTIYLEDGEYFLDGETNIEKNLTIIGESELGTVITHTASGRILRIQDYNDPEADMKVTLRNLTIDGKGTSGNGIHAKYDVTVDLYNVTITGIKDGASAIILDNGNPYADGYHNGVTTTVNAHNVNAETVMLGAAPCTSVADSMSYVTYSNFNYDGASVIGSITKDSVAVLGKDNLKVNGVPLTDDINNMTIITKPADLQKIANGGYAIMERNVAGVAEIKTSGEASHYVTIAKGAEATIDLNGCELALEAAPTANGNYSVLQVKGKLNIIGNGTIKVVHTGTDMGWYALSAGISVEGGEVVIGEGVKIIHEGGTAMAYGIDVNSSSGAVSLIADSATIKSSYIGIRNFNNNKTQVSTIDLENCTVQGKKIALWVQYYTSDGYTEEELNNTLNIDVYNKNNTFSVNDTSYPTPVVYGFDVYNYVDPATGNIIGTSA